MSEGYRLRWEGIRGWAHWLRVRQLGLRLAERSGADPRVVELFALFHDARRPNESWDPEHRARRTEKGRVGGEPPTLGLNIGGPLTGA